MKLGFVTCVQLGLSCMEAIYEVDSELALAITLTDTQARNKSGRVYLDSFCQQNGIELHKSTHINNIDCIEKIKALEIDWLFIIGWSQIANTEILNAPKKGVLGIHPTLLPEGRGRAAIPWAILKGLKRTGVTMMKLDEGVDTGEIVSQLVIPLNEQIDASELYRLVDDAHISLIKQAIPNLVNDSVKLTTQDHSKATVWPGRKPEDGEIDLNGSVYDAHRLVRAVTHPYPGAFTIIEGQKYIVWSSTVEPLSASCDCVGLPFRDGFLKFEDFDILE